MFKPKEKSEELKNNISYKLADEWTPNLDINDYNNRPINYLEVGVYYGNNLISVAKSYASHKDSRLYCIDTWNICENKYKDMAKNSFDIFMKNMIFYNITHNLIIFRGDDYNQINNLEDDLFDIIYINRNCSRVIIEDAILSFRKLKQNGIMIFNNYEWCNTGVIEKGVSSFLSCYYNNIKILLIDIQIFIQKL